MCQETFGAFRIIIRQSKEFCPHGSHILHGGGEISKHWDTGVVLSVKCPTFAFGLGHDLTGHGIESYISLLDFSPF